MEQKPEPRLKVDLLVRVWGMGADGHTFSQNAHAVDISNTGAKLSGIEHQLTTGDTIGVQLKESKARFRVIWVIDSGPLQKVQAGVQLVEGQQCPWKHELAEPEKTAAKTVPAELLNKRRFVRHKIRFPIELRDPRKAGSHMQTNATDIGGRGCYVETMMPLPKDTMLEITFWIDSEKVATTGIVRACDGGVGMGIEFIGLDSQKQQQLQQHIEKLDPGFASSGAVQ